MLTSSKEKIEHSDFSVVTIRLQNYEKFFILARKIVIFSYLLDII